MCLDRNCFVSMGSWRSCRSCDRFFLGRGDGINLWLVVMKCLHRWNSHLVPVNCHHPLMWKRPSNNPPFIRGCVATTVDCRCGTGRKKCAFSNTFLAWCGVLINWYSPNAYSCSRSVTSGPNITSRKSSNPALHPYTFCGFSTNTKLNWSGSSGGRITSNLLRCICRR
jgi:hypothetical protein